MFNRLSEIGLDVKDVRFPTWGAALSCILQFNYPREGFVNDALMTAMGAPWLNTKLVVAVSPDTDIDDAREVYHAIATRCDPARDVIAVPVARKPSRAIANRSWSIRPIMSGLPSPACRASRTSRWGLSPSANARRNCSRSSAARPAAPTGVAFASVLSGSGVVGQSPYRQFTAFHLDEDKCAEIVARDDTEFVRLMLPDLAGLQTQRTAQVEAAE